MFEVDGIKVLTRQLKCFLLYYRQRAVDYDKKERRRPDCNQPVGSRYPVQE